jgi:signal recognition particle subunit SRP54
MGDMKSLIGMIPGMGKALKDVEFDEKALNKVEAIIFSMTQQERENPDILNMSRKKRIAIGCGQDLNQISVFIRQFEQMKKMMHKMTNMPGFGSGAAAPKQFKPGYRR